MGGGCQGLVGSRGGRGQGGRGWWVESPQVVGWGSRVVGSMAWWRLRGWWGSRSSGGLGVGSRWVRVWWGSRGGIYI